MATYPTFVTAPGSDLEPIQSVEIDRAEDGTARGRSYYTSDKHIGKVVHPWMTAAEKATLDAFYTTNRLLAFDYTSLGDNVSRSMLFAGAPKYKREVGEFWTATVPMEQA